MPLVKSKVIVNVTDVFGLGLAAKSKAGKEVVRALGEIIRSVTRPLETYLQGHAKASVKRKAITSKAQAESEAAAVRETSRTLIERAGKRLVAVETAKQVNLESTIEKAIESLDAEATAVEHRPIEQGWLLTWLEGAQGASSDEVRELWARILAAQARADTGQVSKASLALLPLLDQPLALSFERFAVTAAVYGCFPMHEGITIEGIPKDHIRILREVGFVDERSESEFAFREFSLALGSKIGLPLLHTHIGLSHRGWEIAVAVFGNPLDTQRLIHKLPSESEQVEQFRKIIVSALNYHKRPIRLNFGKPIDRKYPVSLVIKGTRSESRTEQQPHRLPEDQIGQFSDVTRALIAQLDAWFDIEEANPS